ncbi:MAG: hypothetical protein OXU29_07350 [Gammaproteobacteria bacterium]|nr:hypothetical protein [Gammaproteobacteria bacterium]
MDAILNRLAPSIAYSKKFGYVPAFHYFLAPREALEKFDALMRMAIERGKPLTDAEVEAAPAPEYEVMGKDGLLYPIEDGSWDNFLNIVNGPQEEAEGEEE